jgi:hypothetical protein
MFGLLDDLLEGVAEEISDAMSDPIGYGTEMLLQPVVDTLDVIDGLSEGELREQAVLRLGADAVGCMLLGEIVSEYLESK